MHIILRKSKVLIIKKTLTDSFSLSAQIKYQAILHEEDVHAKIEICKVVHLLEAKKFVAKALMDWGL